MSTDGSEFGKLIIPDSLASSIEIVDNSEEIISLSSESSKSCESSCSTHSDDIEHSELSDVRWRITDSIIASQDLEGFEVNDTAKKKKRKVRECIHCNGKSFLKYMLARFPMGLDNPPDTTVKPYECESCKLPPLESADEIMFGECMDGIINYKYDLSM